jgi:hypothetical protein
MKDRATYMRQWREKNKRHIRGYDNYYYYTHLLAGRQQAKKAKPFYASVVDVPEGIVVRGLND